MLATESNKMPALPADNLVLPFRTVRSDVIGRVIRLGSVVDTILGRHAYPEPVSHALGEALALTGMLGSALKDDAKLILQTKSDGPLDFLVADFVQPGGKLRGYANFDKGNAALADARGRGDQGKLLGRGHVAMTIDPGGGRDSYQGIVPLANEPLVTAADTYFRQSEQIPTFIRLAVARHYGPAGGGGARTARWRAGGLLIQQLAREGGKRELEGEAHDVGLEGDDDENWNRARHLAMTVEDHELLDPMLSPERLLYRLFHEEGVRVVPATELVEACRCSRERIEMYLQRFGAEELADLHEPDGSIAVTCEFCSRKYAFAPGEFA
jgi:molecular chaperone Hsp33